MTKELKVLQEKSTMSSDSLGQAEKRVKSLQSLLTEKNMEVCLMTCLHIDRSVK